MLLELLAAAAAATADTDHPPGWKPPDWNKRPSAEEIEAAWPTDATRRGQGGRVEVSCTVNVHGLLEDCRVVSEQPANLGFGAAAMLLIPDFVMKPATVMGKPVPGGVRIPINFIRSPGDDAGTFPTDTFTLINHPIWGAAPTFADLGTVYPKNGGGVAGYSAFRCHVDKTGSLKQCDLLREEPPDKGFGRAARALISKFRMDVHPDLLAKKRTLVVNLPIRLIDPASDDFRVRRIGEPSWLTRLDPNKVQKLYPAEAANQGIRTGRGVADCTVTAQGALIDCAPLPATPDGVGFSEAAVQIALAMRMNLWTQEGGPVDGVRLRFPMRFNLAEPTSPPAAGGAGLPTPRPKP